MAPSDISRNESVSSQISSKIDGESVSSSEVPEPDQLSNQLNNNVVSEKVGNGSAAAGSNLSEKIPNGNVAVDKVSSEKSPTVSSVESSVVNKKLPNGNADVPAEGSPAKSVQVDEQPRSNNDEERAEKKTDATPEKSNETKPSADSTTAAKEVTVSSDSPSHNNTDAESVASSTDQMSEENDQLGELPSSTSSLTVSTTTTQNVLLDGVDADHSLSSVLASSANRQSIENPSGTTATQNAGKKASVSDVTEANSYSSTTSNALPKGTSFNSLSKIPPELAAANRKAKSSESIAELPDEEALAINMLDEVLSSDIASADIKPCHSRSTSVATNQEAAGLPSLPSVIVESSEQSSEVFAEENSKDNRSSRVSNPEPNASMTNGRNLPLQANGTQVLFFLSLGSLALIDECVWLLQ